MFPNEIVNIKRELKKRNLENLYCDYITLRKYDEVIKILDLPQWNEKDENGNYIYRHLLTPNIWNSNYENIKSILELEKWNKKDENGNYIYRHLLTPNIWNSNYENIKSILELEKWNEKDENGNYIYRHLLTPTIWTLNNKKIQIVIETIEEYGLEKFITTSLLRKSKIQIIALINYLNENQIPLIMNEKLNPIFNVAPSVLKKKYNIDLKELVHKEQLKGTRVL